MSHDPTLLDHYVTLKVYIGGYHLSPQPPRDTFTRLSESQLQDLRTDIYDELTRRQHPEHNLLNLPSNPTYHPNRNQARRKLASLASNRFQNLVGDIFHELERRFPFLKTESSTNNSHSTSNNTPHNLPPLFRPRSAHAPRVGLNISPSTSLFSNPTSPNLILPASQQRARSSTTSSLSPTVSPISSTYSSPTTSPRSPNHAAISPRSPHHNHTSTSTSPAISPATSPLTPSHTSPRTLEIFKSFRVSMDADTTKVLPAALRKYGISAPWQEYSLYIVCGDHERCLGLEEKPLVIFKGLEREGRGPCFMLRRNGRGVST